MHTDWMVFLNRYLRGPKGLTAIGYWTRVGRSRAVEPHISVETVAEGFGSRL